MTPSPKTTPPSPPRSRRLQGAELRALREARGVSLRALGAALGVSHSFVAHVENGEAPLPTNLIVRVAMALKVPRARIQEMFGVCQACGNGKVGE